MDVLIDVACVTRLSRKTSVAFFETETLNLPAAEERAGVSHKVPGPVKVAQLMVSRPVAAELVRLARGKLVLTSARRRGDGERWRAAGPATSAAGRSPRAVGGVAMTVAAKRWMAGVLAVAAAYQGVSAWISLGAASLSCSSSP
ncbi:hypothetical protein [Nonomuraea sp. NPDC049400]|uniref:hypothetical protein n=1 Tax=Nonomuraea sp. NPDC049400 TaxID=3364352 RepID=UPI003793C656